MLASTGLRLFCSRGGSVLGNCFNFRSNSIYTVNKRNLNMLQLKIGHWKQFFSFECNRHIHYTRFRKSMSLNFFYISLFKSLELFFTFFGDFWLPRSRYETLLEIKIYKHYCNFCPQISQRIWLLGSRKGVENGPHYNQSHKMAGEKMQGHWHHRDRPSAFLANSKSEMKWKEAQ